MKERSLNIAHDCDDVLVPSAEVIVDWYNTTYNTRVDKARFYDGTAEDWGVEDIRLASRRIEEFHYSFFSHPPMPYPEAIIGVKALAKNHRQGVLSGRADFLLPVTEKMAEDYFPGYFHSIVHTSHYGETPKSKSEVCRDLQYDILIDDGLMHCVRAVEEENVKVALLRDQPWNQAEDLHPSIIRCYDWDDIQREVAKIARR